MSHLKSNCALGSQDYPTIINQRLLQTTLEKLHEESTDEAWSAIENILTTKPKKYALSTKTTPLIKAIQRKVSIPFLEILIQYGANVNEIKIYKTNQYWPLKISNEMELHHHSACLIFYGALPNPSLKNSRKGPPIIVATQLVIYEGEISIKKTISSFFNLESVVDCL